MEEEELDKIIEQLRHDNASNSPFFEINLYDGGPDESYIRANKAGLENMARVLLSASKASDSLKNTDDPTYQFSEEANWIGGEILVRFIEFSDAPDEELKETWKEKLISRIMVIGCLTSLIIGSLIMLIGIQTIIDWL